MDLEINDLYCTLPIFGDTTNHFTKDEGECQLSLVKLFVVRTLDELDLVRMTHRFMTSTISLHS